MVPMCDGYIHYNGLICFATHKYDEANGAAIMSRKIVVEECVQVSGS